VKKRDPIGTLLRIRDIRERQARGHLAAQQQQQTKAESELEKRRTAYLERDVPARELTPAQLRVLSLQGIRTLELLNDAARALDEERMRTERVRDAWTRTANEMRSAQRLDERREIDAAVAARKASDKALDELVITLREPTRGRRT
jgi:flagellar biosynthesis chaperone FliJ